MPDPQTERLVETLSRPLEEVLVALASGIGRSQAELDRHSIEIQKQIAEDPVLSQHGAEATWYQIPSAELEIKIAVTIQEPAQPTATPPAGGARSRLWIQPVNAKYQNQFGFDAQATSTLKLSIVPVPPPAGPQRTKTESELLAIAAPHLMQDSAGQPLPRVTVNYNAGARAWYVVQTREDMEPPELRALLKIDDETGTILKRIGGV